MEITIPTGWDEWETFVINELDSDDFPDTEMVPDGYDMKFVPKATDANFQLLVDKHNELVQAVIGLLKDHRLA